MIDLSNKRSLYHIYKRKKANGKVRVIHAPQGALKLEQERLAQALSEIYDPPDSVFGFIKGRCTGDMAKQHVGKDWVVSIDLKDFFPSITKELLLKNGLLDYWSEVATLDGQLVQGSPASPVISNWIMRWKDLQFEVFATIHGITYTRYADDIVLSGDGKPKWQYINFIEESLTPLGLKLNRKKIRFMFKNQRQEVLGVCVNDKVSVDRKVRSQLKFRARRGILTEADKGFLSYINSVMK